MSAIEVFQFPATDQPVRTVVVDGEPWFVARDVATVLGYANGNRDVARHTSERQRREYRIGTPSGAQTVVLLNEPGVYRMVMRSNMPKAVEFQDWLAEEVLPAIRRTGRYEHASTVDKPMTELEMAQRYVAALEREQVLTERLAIAAPKADSWDVLASGDGDWSVADAAKVLSRDPAIKLGRDRLFTLLHQYGWVYRQKADQRWRPYQTAVETRRLSELPASHYHPRTGELVIDPPQVRVTAKGLHELHRRLGGTQPLTIQPELEEVR